MSKASAETRPQFTETSSSCDSKPKRIQHHIHEVVPEVYGWYEEQLKGNTGDRHTTLADPRVKLQARAIANDCYKFILDMTTNAGIVSDALKYVIKKRTVKHFAKTRR